MKQNYGSSMLDEIRFWQIVLASQARTIVCSPENESRVKGFIDARQMGSTYTVKVSPGCPDTSVYMFDEQALQASLNEQLSKPPRLSWGDDNQGSPA